MGKFQDLTGQKFGRLTAIETFIKDGKKYWHCLCDCGKEKDALSGNLRSGATVSCGCGRANDLIGKRFGRLVVLRQIEKRRGNRIYWQCICDCGKEKDVAGCELVRGHVRSCGCYSLEKSRIKDFEDLTGKRFGMLFVLSLFLGENISGKRKWTCLCDCGNTVVVMANNLKNRTSKSCGCGRSFPEKEFKSILIHKNILFIYQKKFDDCVYKCALKFDFYIPDLNLCVELDGLQHFKPVEFFGGEKSFLELQLRDQIKNTYCLEHNINLLRIPYTQFHRLEEICKENKII